MTTGFTGTCSATRPGARAAARSRTPTPKYKAVLAGSLQRTNLVTVPSSMTSLCCLRCCSSISASMSRTCLRRLTRWIVRAPGGTVSSVPAVFPAASMVSAGDSTTHGVRGDRSGRDVSARRRCACTTATSSVVSSSHSILTVLASVLATVPPLIGVATEFVARFKSWHAPNRLRT